MIERILSPENADLALTHMMEKKNTVDITGLELYKLPEYWAINGDFYRDIILKDCYRCERIVLYHHPKPNGKLRTLAQMAHVDMLLNRMVFQILQPLVTQFLSSSCYAFVPGRSIEQIMKKAVAWTEGGYVWCAHLDIRDFFDRIPLDAVWSMVKKLVDDSHTEALLKAMLFAERAYGDQKPVKPSFGLLQGNPTSPMLSNLYLAEFDRQWEEIRYLRFADDIYAFFDNQESAEQWQAVASDELNGKFALEVNHEKGFVRHADGAEMLGWRLRTFYGKWKTEPISSRHAPVYSSWTNTALSPVDRNIWLGQEGTLKIADGMMQFEDNEKQRVRFPLQGLDTIHVMERVHFSSAFFQYAEQARIRVCFYDRYGSYAGDFIPASYEARTDLILIQADICTSMEVYG